jgi:signal transduction histidine kinase/ActR/RegA family two-component response regulator
VVDWLRAGWDLVFGGVRPVSETLLGLACLALAAAIVVLTVRRRGSALSPSRGTAWLLGMTLIVCGFAQLTQAIAVAPRDRLMAIPLLAAVACWAAALTLAPAARRGAVTADEPEATSPEPRRWEDDLHHIREEVRSLTEADARKNEFLAMLGHELRNPLAPIRNALRIMKRSGSDDPDLCWARDVVDHQLRQLGQLIDDLQEIARVISGKVRLQKEPVDVATIVAFAVETSRPTIEAHHHRLSITRPPGSVFIEADVLRMSQVLSNLLNNAAKYTEAGGQIRLTAAVEGSDVVFRVRDNGLGIPPEMLPRIFDLFAQVDHSLDRSEGGLGLGLTLVRSLAELHGGSVEARSEGAGRGSEFLVRLPVLPAARAAAGPGSRTPAPAPSPAPVAASDRAGARKGEVPAQAAGPAAARRVLVVDDNATAAQSLALILKLERYDVQVAYDGEAALKAVRSFRPEAILMDIGLPGLDGHEVARRIRQDPDLASSVGLLAAVSGYAEPDVRRRSREAGFDHHLVKPVDPDAILALLASLEWREESLVPGP